MSITFIASLPVLNKVEKQASCYGFNRICCMKSTSSNAMSSENHHAVRIVQEIDSVTKRKYPPKHKSAPYIGFFIEKLLGTSKSSIGMAKKYGQVYQSSYILGPLTYIASYDAVSTVLNNPKLFTSSEATPNATKLFGETALINLDGDAHIEERQTLHLAFSATYFPHYFQGMERFARESWMQMLADLNKEQPIKLDPVLHKHYLRVFLQLVSGVSDDELVNRMLSLFNTMESSFIAPEFVPARLNPGQYAVENMLNIFRGILLDQLANNKEVIDLLRTHGDQFRSKSSKDALTHDFSVLLVALSNSKLSTIPGGDLDEREVRKLCYTMLNLCYAGFTTTKAASCSALYTLGRDELSRKALIKEQLEAVRRASGKTEVTYQQVMKEMPLLDSYIMEVLRYYPAAPALCRYVAKDTEILGFYIPAGTRLLLDICASHKDEKAFTNAMEFDPLRFTKSDSNQRPPLLLSYGGPKSPHSCIGAMISKVAMKTTIATLLRGYEYELQAEQSSEFSRFPDIRPKSGVVLSSFKTRPL